MLLVFFVAFAVVSWTGCAARNGLGYYLPGDTIPESYALSIEPNLATVNDSFTGRVFILIGVKTTTPVITLNAKGLTIQQVQISDRSTSRDIEVDSWDYDDDREQLNIHVAGRVLANRKYTIYIRFEGMLRNDNNGFFKSFYTSHSGGKKYFAATQFQTVHARTAFPCYDEPLYRTPFDISIKIKRNEIVISNMPISYTVDVEEKLSDDSLEYQNQTWVHFMQTPPIVTSTVKFSVYELGQRNKNNREMLKGFVNRLIPISLTGNKSIQPNGDDPSTEPGPTTMTNPKNESTTASATESSISTTDQKSESTIAPETQSPTAATDQKSESTTATATKSSTATTQVVSDMSTQESQSTSASSAEPGNTTMTNPKSESTTASATESSIGTTDQKSESTTATATESSTTTTQIISDMSTQESQSTSASSAEPGNTTMTNPKSESTTASATESSIGTTDQKSESTTATATESSTTTTQIISDMSTQESQSTSASSAEPGNTTMTNPKSESTTASATESSIGTTDQKSESTTATATESSTTTTQIVSDMSTQESQSTSASSAEPGNTTMTNPKNESTTASATERSTATSPVVSDITTQKELSSTTLKYDYTTKQYHTDAQSSTEYHTTTAAGQTENTTTSPSYLYKFCFYNWTFITYIIICMIIFILLLVVFLRRDQISNNININPSTMPPP